MANKYYLLTGVAALGVGLYFIFSSPRMESSISVAPAESQFPMRSFPTNAKGANVEVATAAQAPYMGPSLNSADFQSETFALLGLKILVISTI